MLADEVVCDDDEILQRQGPRSGKVQKGPGNGGDRNALDNHNVGGVKKRPVTDDSFPAGSR